jgi:hypothetical protein
MKSLSGSAVFSPCGQYRYLLTRQLREQACDGQAKIVTFIMLNPSTADATRNDPTIRKCIGFAHRWHCDTLQVLNIFAVRATLPREMKRAADPIGPDNLEWFARALSTGTSTHYLVTHHLVICAWGVHGAHRGQDRAILRWLDAQGIAPFALGTTRHGHPRHPLYAPYSTSPVPYSLL